MIPSVSTPGELDRDGRGVGRLLADADLADHPGPGSELLGDDLVLTARNPGPDRPVVEGGKPHAGHVLEQCLDPVDQGREQQALDEAVVVLVELLQPGGDLVGVRLCPLPVHLQVDLQCCCSSIGRS